MVPKKIFTTCEISKNNFENSISSALTDNIISSEEYTALNQEVEKNSKCLKDFAREKLYDYSFSSALYEMFMSTWDTWKAKILAEHMKNFTKDEGQKKIWFDRSQEAYDWDTDELTEEIFPFKR